MPTPIAATQQAIGAAILIGSDGSYWTDLSRFYAADEALFQTGAGPEHPGTRRMGR